jgi:hypothetical protein
MGSGGIAPCIPNVGTGDEWPSSFPGHFIPGDTVEKEQNLLRLLGNEPCSSVVQPIVQLLYRLCHPGFQYQICMYVYHCKILIDIYTPRRSNACFKSVLSI